jgi:hypothetical protein
MQCFEIIWKRRMFNLPQARWSELAQHSLPMPSFVAPDRRSDEMLSGSKLNDQRIRRLDAVENAFAAELDTKSSLRRNVNSPSPIMLVKSRYNNRMQLVFFPCFDVYFSQFGVQLLDFGFQPPIFFLLPVRRPQRKANRGQYGEQQHPAQRKLQPPSAQGAVFGNCVHRSPYYCCSGPSSIQIKMPSFSLLGFFTGFLFDSI